MTLQSQCSAQVPARGMPMCMSSCCAQLKQRKYLLCKQTEKVKLVAQGNVSDLHQICRIIGILPAHKITSKQRLRLPLVSQARCEVSHVVQLGLVCKVAATFRRWWRIFYKWDFKFLRWNQHYSRLWCGTLQTTRYTGTNFSETAVLSKLGTRQAWSSVKY